MLILTCGFPACGKSTWAKKAQESVTVNGTTPVILCPDEYRLALTGKPFWVPAEESVWSAVKLTARVLLSRGYTVIIDATHTSKSSRKQWVSIAKAVNAPCKCIWFPVSIDTCKERNALRENPVPDEVYTKMIIEFELPSENEGFIVEEYRQ